MSDMMLVFKALEFAKAKHAGQTRKVSGNPYASHPMAVSYIVAAFKRSRHLEEILAAAILHDTLEDTDTTFHELAIEFTPLVATLVFELSNDPVAIAKYGKLEYQKKKVIGVSSYSLVIKLSDRLHNVQSTPKPKAVHDTVELIQFLRENRRLSKTHDLIAQEIERVCAAFLNKEQQ